MHLHLEGARSSSPAPSPAEAGAAARGRGGQPPAQELTKGEGPCCTLRGRLPVPRLEPDLPACSFFPLLVLPARK